jgi:hypothetical protein
MDPGPAAPVIHQHPVHVEGDQIELGFLRQLSVQPSGHYKRFARTKNIYYRIGKHFLGV